MRLVRVVSDVFGGLRLVRVPILYDCVSPLHYVIGIYYLCVLSVLPCDCLGIVLRLLMDVCMLLIV